jgi:predicted transcriptional regulator
VLSRNFLDCRDTRRSSSANGVITSSHPTQFKVRAFWYVVDLVSLWVYSEKGIKHSLFFESHSMPDAPDQTASSSAAQSNYVELAADIVAAYVTKNAVQTADLPSLIATVHSALSKTAQATTEQPQEKLEPAVSIKKSITPDYLVCLDDGKKFKSLKRHLRTAYKMTPDQYRAKWGLRDDYPMVAPNYAKARSALAKTMGLGQKRAASRKRSKKAV